MGQNIANGRQQKHRKYRGVYTQSGTHDVNRGRDGGKKYYAAIRTDTKLLYLGSYETKKEAAIAYNNAAKEIYGEYAYQNVIE